MNSSQFTKLRTLSLESNRFNDWDALSALSSFPAYDNLFFNVKMFDFKS